MKNDEHPSQSMKTNQNSPEPVVLDKAIIQKPAVQAKKKTESQKIENTIIENAKTKT